MAKAKFPEINTPVGTAIYPRINKPDVKFNPAGMFSMRLRLTEEEAAPLIAEIDKLSAEAFDAECKKKGRKLKVAPFKPYKPASDKEKQEDGSYEDVAVPGFVDFNLKRKASGETRDGRKWTAKVALFDSGSPPKPTSVEVWGGSRVRARVGVVPWFTDALGFGIKLDLRAVQIITLVQGGERDAAGYGFDEVEGGFASTDGGASAASTEESGDGKQEGLDEF